MQHKSTHDLLWDKHAKIVSSFVAQKSPPSHILCMTMKYRVQAVNLSNTAASYVDQPFNTFGAAAKVRDFLRAKGYVVTVHITVIERSAS